MFNKSELEHVDPILGSVLTQGIPHRLNATNELDDENTNREDHDDFPELMIWPHLVQKGVAKYRQWIENGDQACIGIHTEDHCEVGPRVCL
jgi:hypothetical protein